MVRLEQYNVIVYGVGNSLNEALNYLKLRFNIIGCSDTKTEKANATLTAEIPFFRPEELATLQYDYIVITSIYDDEICQYLTDEIGVTREKILTRNQWCYMRFHYEYGELNADKTFYVLSRPIRIKNGLLSSVFAFLEQLDFVDRSGYIPVADLKNYPNQYLEDDKVGVENAWEYYFEPFSEYSLEEVYASKNIILGYDAPFYINSYEVVYDIPRMSELYKKYIHIKKEIKEIIDKEYHDTLGNRENVLGVLYRGTDINALRLKNHPIQPSIGEMKQLIWKYMREWQCENIFLSTEDACAADEFKKEFGELLTCTNQERFQNTGKSWLAEIHAKRANDKYLRGLEYLTTIELLTRCKCLVAGICTGSVCAHIMKGEYEHIHMIDKGEYL